MKKGKQSYLWVHLLICLSYEWIIPVRWMKDGIEQHMVWLLTKKGMITLLIHAISPVACLLFWPLFIFRKSFSIKHHMTPHGIKFTFSELSPGVFCHHVLWDSLVCKSVQMSMKPWKPLALSGCWPTWTCLGITEWTTTWKTGIASSPS